jgi:tRNA threonylcarbamoyladenosine biosynthesis protein TsaE
LLASAAATEAVGRQLAGALSRSGADQAIVHLSGDLGVGKTTFARGFIRALGHTGRVPSPTYTLVEPYEFDGFTAYHVDLYRLTDPVQVDDLGLLDLIGPGCVMLIEWPEHAGERLPPPDLTLSLALDGDGRALRLAVESTRGQCFGIEKM